MSRQMTLQNTLNATFSQVLEAGQSRCALQAGQTIDPFGLEVAHASLFPAQEKEKGKVTKDIYGQSGLTSLSSQCLQRSLESRLVQQLNLDGWMKSIMTWRVKAMPSGRQYCQLAVSVRRTKETDCGLWASPNTMDCLPPRSQEAMQRQFNTTRKGRTSPSNLREQVLLSMWPTPSSRDWKDTQGMKKTRKDGKPRMDQLARVIPSNGYTAQTKRRGQLNPAFVCWLMGYPVNYEKLVFRALETQSCRK